MITGSPPSGRSMVATPAFSRPLRAGFTLLEVVTVVVIVLILTVMLFPVFSSIQERVATTRCTSNLKNLHVGADLYLQDHHSWPQVRVSGMSELDTANAWIATLRPYGLEPPAWVCPTSQKRLGNPDFTVPENIRVDYIANPFQPGPLLPFKYPNQPWFVERFNEHGHGNLILFPDGHVEDMMDVLARSGHATLAK